MGRAAPLPVELRRLTPAGRPGATRDDLAVGTLFDRTIALGRPLPFALAGLRHHRRLCLGWYLERGRATAALLELHGRAVGYVLVCTDDADRRRWLRTHGTICVVRLAASVVFAPGDDGCRARAFVRDRLHDRRRSAGVGADVAPVRAHLNLDGVARNGTAAMKAVAHVDACARAAGATAWYGEVGALGDRRTVALERLGLEVLARRPNRTLTRVVGRPVTRLTVLRRIPPAMPEPPPAHQSGGGAVRAISAAQR